MTTAFGKWPPFARLVVDLRGATPVPKGSMKAFVPRWKPGQSTRPIATVTDSKSGELRAYARDLRELASREMLARSLPCAKDQPFEVLLCYYLQRPSGDVASSGALKKSARVTPWVKPDLDKLERATLDALTGVAWDDDSRVVRTVKEKRFATATRDVGVWIELRVQPATVAEEIDWSRLRGDE